LLAGLLNGQQSQQEVADLKRLTMEELAKIEVVSVTKEPTRLERTPAAIHVLTREDIRRSGATSIPDLLRFVPGVEVSRIDSSTWAVGIRGFGTTFSRSVLVLIDGRSVYTPLFAGVNWKLQNVLLEDVERIEVIRGPGGTIWGSNAVNGVINIITRNSRDTRGVFASAGGGNLDQAGGGFRYGGNLGSNLSYRFYGMAFSRGPEFHNDHGNFDDWRLGQGGFRMDWDNQRRDAVTVQGDLYKGEIGQRQSIAYYLPPSSVNLEKTQDVSGGNFLVKWRRKVNDWSDIQVQGYYDRTYRFGAQLGETRDTFDLDIVHHITRLHRHDIAWGIGGRWSPSDFVQTVATVDFQPHQQSDNLYSTFVQDEIAIVEDKLWVTVGSKFEHNRYTGWETQPGARLVYTPTHHQTWWGAITRAVRTPSRLDQDIRITGLATLNPVPVFARISGSPTFRSESLLGYEAGYRTYIRNAVSMDISGFYNSYDHLLSLEPGALFIEPAPQPPHVVLPIVGGNGLRASTTGFEIAPQWNPANWFRLDGSWSYLNMNVKTRPSSSDTSTPRAVEGSSPRHQAAVRAAVDLPRSIELSLGGRYVSALPAQQVRSYATADARVAWRPVPHIEFSIVGQNLIQPHHPEFGGDPGGLIGIRRGIFAQIAFRN